MFRRSLYVLFPLAIVLSVLLRFTDCDYPFGIFKLFFLYISPLEWMNTFWLSLRRFNITWWSSLFLIKRLVAYLSSLILNLCLWIPEVCLWIKYGVIWQCFLFTLTTSWYYEEFRGNTSPWSQAALPVKIWPRCQC